MNAFKRKFLVFNLKDIDNSRTDIRDAIDLLTGHVAVQRMKRGAEMDPTYYVCNSDEPYASRVLDIILNDEEPKADTCNCIGVRSYCGGVCDSCGGKIPGLNGGEED